VKGLGVKGLGAQAMDAKRVDAASRTYGASVDLIVSKIDVIKGAKFVTPPTTATLTRAAINPYSTEVAAALSRISLKTRFVTSFTWVERWRRSPSRWPRGGPDRLSRLEPSTP